MKHVKFLSLFLAVNLISQLQAASYFGPTKLEKANLGAVIIFGPADLKEIKADSLQVNGPLNFNSIDIAKETKILGPVIGSKNGRFSKLEVVGPLKANNLVCEELHVIGPVFGASFKVNNQTTIVGPLEVRKSKFANITVTANKIFLQDVSLKNLMIMENNEKNKTQTLILKGKSIVKGDIIFSSGKGKILADKGVMIQGAIKGAQKEIK